MSKKINIRRPILLATLMFVSCMLLSSCAKKPQEQKVYRVGIFGIDAFAKMADGFKSEMTKLGYAEDKSIVYDVQIVNVISLSEEQRILRKFIDDKVDLIFAFPTDPAISAKAATEGTNIPVVFGFAGLEGNNLVKNVRQPGGNITGIRFTGPDSTAKRLEILHEMAPNAKRIGLMCDRNYPNVNPSLETLHQTALSIDVTLVEIPITKFDDIQTELDKREASTDMGIDAFLMMPDALTHSLEGFKLILKFANEHKLPVGGGQVYMVELGAIFGYSPYDTEVGEQAANLADKIFKGTPAGTISIVSPENHLEINYKVTQELGLTVPQGLLSRADKIIR